MSKTYIKPAIHVRSIETVEMMAASDPTGASVMGEAPTNATGLSKRHSIWDTEETGFPNWSDK
jgi:hypothetical protein